MLDTDPLILTATLDASSAEYFQRARDRHFPPHLNVVPAHLTLFHHLPGLDLTAIDADLEVSCTAQAPIPFRVSGLRFLGRGVAWEIEALPLAALRQRLAALWHAVLTNQDRQGFRPHVTVQNKVQADQARALYERLGTQPHPAGGTIVGLDLWHYRHGPWGPARRYEFGGEGPTRLQHISA